MNGAGGMGSSGVMSSGAMNGGAMGSNQGMDGAAMGMSGSALSVGANGTLYILSRVLPAQTTDGAVSTRLSALSSATGAILWSVVFDESWLSKPVEGPDGRLFLVAMGGPDMGQGGASGGDSGQEIDSKLYIVDPSTQQVVAVTLAGEVASVPLIGGSDALYTVYVVTFDMGYHSDNSGQGQGIHRDSTLYALARDGSLKFKISLNQ